MKNMDKPSYNELAESLMDMVNQHCYYSGEIVRHDFISANEDAFCLLERLNLLIDLGQEKYKINWKGLKNITQP